MASDPATGNVILFGGETTGYPATVLQDTWAWDGSDWVEESPAAHPPARLWASMAPDPATGNVVLFSGYSGSRMLHDTWTWG